MKNSKDYAAFINNLNTTNFTNFTIILVILLGLPILIYCIFYNYEGIFEIPRTNCIPVDERWSAEQRKNFASLARTSPEETINATSWEISPNRPYITLTLTSNAFAALQGHSVVIPTPTNESIDFSQVPTKNQTNIRDILKITSPNFTPTICHYSELTSNRAIHAEYSYLQSMHIDPHALINKHYYSTFNRAMNQFMSNLHPAKPCELAYLKLLSDRLNLSEGEKHQFKAKYFIARFNGHFLDFTNLNCFKQR